jgi:uncharacterized tellurite resistance protein B-like protein
MVWQTLKAGLFSMAIAQKQISLYEKLQKQMPHADETTLLKSTAMAGLLCSVAFSDLKISSEERKQIAIELKKWSALSPKEIELITEMSADEIKEFSAVSTSDYSDYLGNNLSIEERYKVLLSLFTLAAAQDGVSALETEEIRILCKGLLLEHKHFVAAQATVKEHLNSLKS